MNILPSQQRLHLDKLVQEVGEYITVKAAAQALNTTEQSAAKTLAHLRRQGWLNRVTQGLYTVAPLATPSESALDDPYVLISLLFSPGYVGGWSAAMHWHLTEQIFHDICVVTAKTVRRNRQTIYHIPFMVTHMRESQQIGTIAVWRNEHKVLFSDPSKTIIDMLAFPKLGGGMSHVKECFATYIRSEHFAPELLLKYAAVLENGAVFKRLGYLTEQLLGVDHALVHSCTSSLTKGKIQYDPMLKSTRLATRWQMFVPETFL